VVSGKDGAVLHELGRELEGPGIVTSLAGGRDVDGDGRPDVVLFRTTADDPYADRSPETLGVVAIYSGSTGELLRVIASPQHTGSVGDEPQAWLAPGVPNGAVALVADRNGDGRAELALTLCLDEDADDYRKRSELDVIDVRSLATFTRHRLPPLVLGPPWLLREIDDLDGDGAPDLLLSVVEDFTVVLSGARDEEIRCHAYDDPYQYGEGSSLDVLGDVNDDCVPDYLVAANEDGLDCDVGFVVVASGADGKDLHRLDFGRQNTLRLDRNGREFFPGQTWACGPGADACAIADVDGDGKRDVAVHVPRLGQVRILSGATFEEIVRVDTDTLMKETDDAPR
jgi:hypothetical protein